MSIFVDIEKKLGSFCLKVKFQAADETMALLGASGCGKSLTLRCIAGIEKPDRGRIVVDDAVLFDSEKGICLSPQERRTGLMFQNYALFPNMTVLQNIQAGARREKDAAIREKAVADVLDSFDLGELTQRYPSQISGGQQQRVALARILVSHPRILLLDEPFSALDSHLRFRLEQEVRKVIRRFGKTVLLVSHDRDEVFRMSDSIVILHDGQVETAGTKEAVFANPETRVAAMLTGCKNISRAERIDREYVKAIDWKVTVKIQSSMEKINAVGIRMHDVCYGTGENTVDCRVVEEIENPFSYTVMLRPAKAADSLPIGWEVDKDTWRSIRAEQITVHLPPEAILPLKEKRERGITL